MKNGDYGCCNTCVSAEDEDSHCESCTLHEGECENCSEMDVIFCYKPRPGIKPASEE
jgi:hypothetical protein